MCWLFINRSVIIYQASVNQPLTGRTVWKPRVRRHLLDKAIFIDHGQNPECKHRHAKFIMKRRRLVLTSPQRYHCAPPSLILASQRQAETCLRVCSNIGKGMCQWEVHLRTKRSPGTSWEVWGLQLDRSTSTNLNQPQAIWTKHCQLNLNHLKTLHLNQT